MARVSLPSVDDVPGGRALAGLSRRVRTLIVAGVLFLVLFILALVLPVPYVILSPGPTYNTLGVDDRNRTIIVVNGAENLPAGRANATSGHLNMTTVSVSGDSVSAFQALAGWLAGDEVVVPRADVYPPGQSQQQVERQNSLDFQQSQDSATAAALCELSYPVGFGIIEVDADGPAQGKLRVGDRLVSVDGTAVASKAAVGAVLTGLTPGRSVPVVVQRNGATTTVAVTVGALPASPGAARPKGASLGIQSDKTCLAPFSIDLGLGQEIGGPSAGLMFALGIIDKVGSYAQLGRKIAGARTATGDFDLTGGAFVAGTGTIDKDGNVGAIGGISLKMIAARGQGATVFLAPKGNCEQVKGAIPRGLRVIPVSTLSDALTDLFVLKAGTKTDTLPTC